MRIRSLKKRIALMLSLILMITGSFNVSAAEVPVTPLYAEDQEYDTEAVLNESGEETEDAFLNGSGEETEEESIEVSEFDEYTEEESILRAEGDETEETDEDNAWHTEDFDGIWWRVSSNVLLISANSEAKDPRNIGKIPNFSHEGTMAWQDEKYKSKIKRVTMLPSSLEPDKEVTEVGDFAFEFCKNLESIDIPASVMNIGYGAFMGCEHLSSVTVTENDRFLTSSTGILYKKSPEGLIMLFAPLNRPQEVIEIDPDTVEIGNYACYGAACYKGAIKIPAKCKLIGQQAFKGCENADSVVIGVRYYGDDIDTDKCTSNLNEIKSDAFDGCTKIQSFYLPSSVSSIDPDCLTQDNYLRYVYYYAVDDSLSDHTKMVRNGNNCSGLSTLKIPKGSMVYVPWNHCIIHFVSNMHVTGDIKGVPLLPVCVEFKQTLAETGTTSKELYKLAKTDYYFYGWIRKLEGSFFNETDIVETDIELNAKWTAMYKIKFVTGGGEFPSDGTKTRYYTISANDTISENGWPEDPVKADSTFVGWQIGSKEYGSILIKNVDDKRASKFVNIYDRLSYRFPAENLTLNAFYAEYPSLTFWDEYGTEQLGSKMNITFGTNMNREQKEYLDSLSENFWRDRLGGDPAYVFSGWWSDPEGQGIQLNTSKLLYGSMPRKYYIFFKHYLKMTYYYGFDVDGKGDPEGKREYSGIEAGKDYDIEVPATRKGYMFKGWWSTEDETGTKYGSRIVANKNFRNLTFYAHWQKLCTISLNRMYEKVYDEEYLDKNPKLRELVTVENVTSGNALYYDPGMIPYDKRELLDEGDRLKFEGWYTEPDGKGEKIESTTVIDKDMVLYAHWVKGWAVDYFVDIKETGGRVLFWGTVLTPGDKLVLPPEELGDPDPEIYNYKGFLFDGWEDEEGNKPDTSKTVTKDMVFTARWYDDPNSPNDPQVTVSFDSLGGPEIESQTVSVNTPVEEPDHGSWNDHVFEGWFTDTDFNRQWDFEKDTVSENMYLYARWKYWTEEMEAEYQDNLKGIYWVRIVRGEKISLSDYFTESGLIYSYDKDIIKLRRSNRTIKGKQYGSTLVTAVRSDGSSYEKAVRVFVIEQVLLDMYAFNTSTTFDAVEFLTVSGFLPDRWESSKPRVANIDPNTGFIQVNARGTTKIKAFYKEKPVVATLHSLVPKFARSFVRFKTGQRKKLRIKKLKKYDIVSWNIVSDNSRGSAEIDENGRLTALTAGDVTVFASVYGETISCKVHIEPPLLKQKSLELDINKRKKIKLSNTRLKHVEWTTTNDRIAYVDPVSGVIYALRTGRVVFRTTAGGVVNSCSVVITDPLEAKKKKKQNGK